jgi:hypothetical protein
MSDPIKRLRELMKTRDRLSGVVLAAIHELDKVRSASHEPGGMDRVSYAEWHKDRAIQALADAQDDLNATQEGSIPLLLEVAEAARWLFPDSKLGDWYRMEQALGALGLSRAGSAPSPEEQGK